MKILIVAHDSKFRGGANRSLVSVIDRLCKEKDIDMTVLVPSKQGAFNEALDEIGIKWVSVPYHKLITSEITIKGKFKLFLKTILDVLATILLAFKVKKKKFDIIYTNTRVVHIGALLSKLLCIPHVWHIREFTNEKRSYVFPYEYKLMGITTKRIIAISNVLKESIIKNIKEDKVVTIYNGFSTVNVNKKDHNGFNLLVTGRIQPQKGQIEAVRALIELHNRDIDDVYLHIAGSSNVSSKPYFEEIKRLARENNVEQYLVFHGEVENMSFLRSIMDVELNCSESEGFGRVTVEGMQSGLVMIGANCSATPEIIKHKKNGLLYRKGDINNLAETIETVYKDRELAKSLVENALAFTKDNFTIEQNSSEIYKVFRGVYKETN